MKKIAVALVVLVFVLTNPLLAQSLNCKQFKNGTFETTYRGKTTVIKRSDSTQVEYVKNSRIVVSFVVKWVDDCTYTLKPNQDYFNEFVDLPHNMLLTVGMSKLTENSYMQTTTSNYSPVVLTTKVIKVPGLL